MDIDQTQNCCFTHEENWFRCRMGALILEENAVLVATNAACAFCYSIGGGVHLGETAEEAGLEETGPPYEIDRLAFVHENFFEGEGSIAGLHCHELSFYFLMKPMGKREITKRGRCVDGEEWVCWLPVDRLSDYTVYPLVCRMAPPSASGDRPHRHRPPSAGAEKFR